MIPCELDLKSTAFCDTVILTYETYVSPVGNKIGFNLFYNEGFTIPYFIDKISNSPDIFQITKQAKKNLCIIDISGEELIMVQGARDEVHRHQTQRVKSKVNISIFRSNRYQRKYFEEIQYRFDRVIPVVSHLDVCLPDKPLNRKEHC